MASTQTMRRLLYIAALIIAGEMVFSLPFHVPRFFRPTLLEVFGFSSTQLGDLFAVYGITAMLSYFPGGPLADRFSARALLTASLVATAAGGLVMATIPGAMTMAILYGFWGVTTIFLFWGALIRATREWGGGDVQGTAFGILDGGRGLVQAAFAYAMVRVLALYLADDVSATVDADRRTAMQMIILCYSAGTLAAAALVWFVMPANTARRESSAAIYAGIGEILRRPVIWAQAGIVICAYCCYKGFDYYVHYANVVLGMDEVQASDLAQKGSWIRPIAAVLAGLIADRFDATRSLGVIFGVLVVAYAVLANSTPDNTTLVVIYGNLVVTLFAFFALRGIYFALLEETRTPAHLTGAAVGVISVVGFTPDFFFYPIASRILDASPGAPGFLNYFAFLAGIALAGLAVVIWLAWLKRNNQREQAVS